MKTRFQFGLFALALLMAGCGGNKGGEAVADRPIIQMDSIDYPDLPDGATIRMSKSDFPKGKIRSIEQIPIEGLEITNREIGHLVVKDYLIIKHLEKQQGAYLLHVVSLPDYRVVAELAPFGEGPDDFQDICLVPTEENDKLCYVWNFWDKRLYYLSNDLSLVPCGHRIAPKGGSSINLFVGKDLLLAEHDSPEGKGIVAVNQRDSTITGLIPLHFTKGARGYFYYLNFAYSFQKRRCAIPFLYHDRIGFFDFDGGHPKFIRFGDRELKTLASPENPMYYYDCFANDHYVFAIYRPSDYDTEKDRETFLEQYDWDGNLVARYELPKDRGFYSGYATNESDTEIYLVDYYEDQFLHRVTLERP